MNALSQESLMFLANIKSISLASINLVKWVTSLAVMMAFGG
jgi:hypothetical protein